MGVRLRKRGQGGFFFAVFYDRDKQPREKTIALKTNVRNDAMEAFTTLRKKWEAGKYDPWNPDRKPRRKHLPLAAALDEFLTQKRQDGRKPATLRAYRLFAESLVKVAPPGIMLGHLAEPHLRAYIHAAKADGSEVSPATKRHRMRHARAFVKWATRRQLIDENPLRLIDLPKAPKKNAEFLTRRDVDAILSAIDAWAEMNDKFSSRPIGWLKDVVLVAIGTGMRLGELCALRWEHVDLAEREINLPASITKAGADRSVPLVSPALEVLETRAASGKAPGGHALTYSDGSPLRAGYVSKRFKKFSRLAMLPESVHFHTLRHTAASWLVSEGATLREVQEFLGHSQISTTEIYSHLVKSNLKERAQRFMSKALER